jgi:hypothetical protein
MKKIFKVLVVLSVLVSTFPSFAHHVLGRPAYSLNEDSNTPPSMQIETRIGDFFVTYMVYPAFPRPGVAGRINLYAVNIKTNEPFDGKVSFEVKDDSWFASPSEIIGTQLIDDSVYRQGFVVNKRGDYIITAKFTSNDEPYTIDFPLRIGVPSQFTLPVIIIGSIFFVLILVSIMQRKRLMQMRIRDSKE